MPPPRPDHDHPAPRPTATSLSTTTHDDPTKNPPSPRADQTTDQPAPPPCAERPDAERPHAHAQQQTVRVGVGTLLIHPPTGKFLVGRRKNSHGAGTVALPGGHLEMFEDWATCAARECAEETGLVVPAAPAGEKEENWQLTFVSNNLMRAEGKHYITLFMRAEVGEGGGEPPRAKNLEPDKCEGWQWVTMEELG